NFQEKCNGRYNNEWESYNAPISATINKTEKFNGIEFLLQYQSANPTAKKIILIFFSLLRDLDENEQFFLKKIVLSLKFYDEPNCSLDEAMEGENEKRLASFLNFFKSLHKFIKREYKILSNLIQQLTSLLQAKGKSENEIISLSMVPQLHIIYNAIGRHVGILHMIDRMIAENKSIIDHWNKFKKMIKSIELNPTKFNANIDELRRLEKVMKSIEFHLLDGTIFRIFLESLQISQCQLFIQELNRNIMIDVIYQQKLINESSHEIVEGELLLLIAVKFMLIHQFTGKFDQTLFKMIMSIDKKLPVTVLSFGMYNLLFGCKDFLLKFLPSHITMTKQFAKNKERSKVEKQNFVNWKFSRLQKQYIDFHKRCTQWKISIHQCWLYEDCTGSFNDQLINQLNLSSIDLIKTSSNEDGTLTNIDILSKKFELFFTGYQLIKECKKIILFFLCILEDNRRNSREWVKSLELTKSLIHLVHQYIIEIKQLRISFQRISMRIVSVQPVMFMHLSNQILNSIDKSIFQLQVDKKPNSFKLECLEILSIFRDVLNGPPSSDRLLICRVSIPFFSRLPLFVNNNFADSIHELGTTANLLKLVSDESDLSFLYQHTYLYEQFIDDMKKQNVEVKYFEIMTDAFIDVFELLKEESTVEHLKFQNDSQTELIIESYSDRIENIIDKHLIKFLCKNIEEDLRVYTHQHLKLDPKNPFLNEKVKELNLNELLQIKPFRLANKIIDIKYFVEHFLSENFYNLTAISLHNYETYTNMKQLAFFKYNLDISDTFLPSQTIEQSQNIIDTIRNFSKFVSDNNYNLNMQTFIQKNSNSKYLQVLKISHINESLRTLGVGVVNTTVECVYRYLGNKMKQLSKFLFNEEIKSRLVKDLKYFNDNKVQLKQHFPFELAEKANKNIRKLGFLENNYSYYEYFRLLLTQIGNAMGYLRLIQTGHFSFISNCNSLAPDWYDIEKFELLLEEESSTNEISTTAAKNIDNIFESLQKNSDSNLLDGNFLRKIVTTFSEGMQQTKNRHLANFYIIIPSMTINFVEHIKECKERLQKNEKIGAAFTDDGFAFGIAFILKLLGQYEQFDALHWFKSLRNKYTEDKRTIKNELVLVRNVEDKNLRNTLTLSENRINKIIDEFNLLEYSLASARIFFKDWTESNDKKLLINRTDKTENEPSN
ncbi:hypothetical protein SNEBB_009586, partial [Seison nebaliae]